MLAKLTSKNQITIPKSVLSQIPSVKYFDVEFKDEVVILRPVEVYKTDFGQIRAKMKKLGLTEESVPEAVRWARSR
ncbi:MAG: AbrB/MazE/SpoVT family DNA-binding domain-containing protein [Deltaproteobacteria bacterium]|nr:AbrB/MazE/SpoVT family DNA-binding domain-containing protein [Deltaproteobacteria bacterium]